MNGDYSRLTFDPSRNHSSVRMQQGRVLLDSDWNEQADLINRRTRAAIIDTFGRLRVASPEAFAISLGPGGLMIGRGRMYVDGLIAENHGWGTPVRDPALDELHGRDRRPGNLTCLIRRLCLPPAARTSSISYVWATRDHLNRRSRPDRSRGWRRHDDAAADRVAGPDFGRCVWDCRAARTGIAAFAPSRGRLTAETGRDGYTGAENRLYRVEIHDGGEPGRATFKWSRENAAVSARVRVVGPAQLLLDGAAERFATGDWIEITDDRRELTGIPGEMRRDQRHRWQDYCARDGQPLPVQRFRAHPALGSERACWRGRRACRPQRWADRT